MSEGALYGFLYTLIILDSGLFIAWAATIFYLYTECPSTLTNHAMFALYFLQLWTVIYVSSAREGVKEPSPFYWLTSSLVTFFFSLTLFLAQFAPTPHHAPDCSYVLLYKILSGTGLCISLLSLSFWTVLRIMSRKARAFAQGEAKKKKSMDLSESLLK